MSSKVQVQAVCCKSTPVTMSRSLTLLLWELITNNKAISDSLACCVPRAITWLHNTNTEGNNIFTDTRLDFQKPSFFYFLASYIRWWKHFSKKNTSLAQVSLPGAVLNHYLRAVSLPGPALNHYLRTVSLPGPVLNHYLRTVSLHGAVLNHYLRVVNNILTWCSTKSLSY